MKLGFSRKDDSLPQISEEHLGRKDDLDTMLNEYYEFRGSEPERNTYRNKIKNWGWRKYCEKDRRILWNIFKNRMGCLCSRFTGYTL